VPPGVLPHCTTFIIQISTNKIRKEKREKREKGDREDDIHTVSSTVTDPAGTVLTAVMGVN
jgi:hypothetical protein